MGLHLNIIYVLGNGFDLHNGLKTKYGDFYRYLEKLTNKEKELPDEKKVISNNQIYKAIIEDGIEQ